MKMFAKYYNTMFEKNLGDDLIICRLINECPTEGSFLDLCCGTGRVLSIALQNDMSVVGIDNNGYMLQEAKNYLSCFSNNRVSLVLGDALSIDYEDKFSIVTCAANCIGFFISKSKRKALLSRVYKSLRMGGLFYIESYSPGNPKDGFYRHSTYETPEGILECVLTVKNILSDKEKYGELEFIYNLSLGGKKDVEIYRVDEIHKDELINIAEEVGFYVVGVFGDSNCSVPYNSKSEYQSFILKKAQN